MEKKTSNNKDLLFFKFYKLTRKISSGSFGVVFSAKILKNSISKSYIDSKKISDEKYPNEVAIKLEEISYGTEKLRSVQREAVFLKELKNIQGIPKMIWTGSEHSYDVLILELLGKNLTTLMKTIENKE